MNHKPICGPIKMTVAASVFLLCGACSFKPDSELEAHFSRHKDDFDKLVAVAIVDCTVGGKVIGFDSKPPKGLDIPDERWQRFQTLLHETGIRDGVGRRYDYPSAVFLYQQCMGGAVAHDCKGYAYSTVPLKPLQDNWDRLAPGFRFKALSGNWYLFRDGG
jgi:hypothetical protein